MDRNSVTGLALIALIMIVWLQFMSPEKKQLKQDAAVRTELAARQAEAVQTAPVPSSESFGAFASAAGGKEQAITVENDLFRATLSSKGATLTSLVLKKHLDGNHQPFNLVNSSKNGALSLLFLTRDGKKIDTRDLYFRTATIDTLHTLKGKESYAVHYHLDAGSQQAVDITYLFSGESYKIDYDVRLTGFASELAGNEYQLQWDGGLAYSEKNRQDEAQSAMAGAFLGGSLVKLDAAKENQAYREEQSGEAKWVAVRNKYFVAALIPQGRTEGFFLGGKRKGKEFEEYVAALKMAVPPSGTLSDNHFSLYLGPLDYNTVKAQNAGLEKIMDFGWEWLTRPFAEYIILPVFSWMNGFMGNFGLIIIIFAFLIKTVTYPLSMASTKSMKKMSALQPALKELQEKYKDNPA